MALLPGFNFRRYANHAARCPGHVFRVVCTRRWARYELRTPKTWISLSLDSRRSRAYARHHIGVSTHGDGDTVTKGEKERGKVADMVRRQH